MFCYHPLKDGAELMSFMKDYGGYDPRDSFFIDSCTTEYTILISDDSPLSLDFRFHSSSAADSQRRLSMTLLSNDVFCTSINQMRLMRHYYGRWTYFPTGNRGKHRKISLIKYLISIDNKSCTNKNQTCKPSWTFPPLKNQSKIYWGPTQTVSVPLTSSITQIYDRTNL